MNTSKILKESTYVTIDITNFNFSRHIGHDTLPKNDALRQLDIGDLSRPRFEGFPFCKVNATPLIDIVRVALVVTRCFIRSTMIRTRNLPVIDHPFVMSPCFPCWRFYLTSFPVFRVNRCFDMLNGMDLCLYWKFSCVNYLRIIIVETISKDL